MYTRRPAIIFFAPVTLHSLCLHFGILALNLTNPSCVEIQKLYATCSTSISINMLHHYEQQLLQCMGLLLTHCNRRNIMQVDLLVIPF